MKKKYLTVFVALLVGICSNAMADRFEPEGTWIKVYKNPEQTAYADSISIKKGSHNILMWSMDDLDMPETSDGGMYLSLVLFEEYDCTKKRLRGVAAAMYSEHMGKGKIVQSNSSHTQPWEAVTGREDEVMWNFACGKN